MTTATEQFARNLESMKEIMRFIETFLSHLQRQAEECSVMVFAAEEIFTNMVKYNPQGPPQVTMKLTEEAGKLTLEMEDRSEQPFDLTTVAPVDTGQPLDQRQPGGLGIHLVKTLMDDVRYSYENGISRTTLVKYLENSHV